jgi:glycyl-tRNA synthetase beta subunit
MENKTKKPLTQEEILKLIDSCVYYAMKSGANRDVVDYYDSLKERVVIVSQEQRKKEIEDTVWSHATGSVNGKPAIPEFRFNSLVEELSKI